MRLARYPRQFGFMAQWLLLAILGHLMFMSIGVHAEPIAVHDLAHNPVVLQHCEIPDGVQPLPLTGPGAESVQACLPTRVLVEPTAHMYRMHDQYHYLADSSERRAMQQVFLN